MKNLEITAEKVREAASKCSTAAATLKVLFPEAFVPTPFHFGVNHQITTESTPSEKPLFIGNGYAPHGLEYKCLIVNRVYEMKVTEHYGWTVLTFTKK